MRATWFLSRIGSAGSRFKTCSVFSASSMSLRASGDSSVVDLEDESSDCSRLLDADGRRGEGGGSTPLHVPRRADLYLGLRSDGDARLLSYLGHPHQFFTETAGEAPY